MIPLTTESWLHHSHSYVTHYDRLTDNSSFRSCPRSCKVPALSSSTYIPVYDVGSQAASESRDRSRLLFDPSRPDGSANSNSASNYSHMAIALQIGLGKSLPKSSKPIAACPQCLILTLPILFWKTFCDAECRVSNQVDLLVAVWSQPAILFYFLYFFSRLDPSRKSGSMVPRIS